MMLTGNSIRNIILLLAFNCYVKSEKDEFVCGKATRAHSVCYPGQMSHFKRFRIQNGCRPNVDSWPWLVSLRITDQNGSHGFGEGFIITKYHILTAAHNLSRMNSSGVIVHVFQAKDVDLFFGGFTREEFKLGQGTRKTGRKAIHRIKINEQFDFIRDNDIAIIELKEPLVFSSAIQPICLSNKSVEPFTWTMVAGWGRQNPSERSDGILRQTAMQIETDENCQKKCLLKNEKLKQFGSGFCAVDEKHESATGHVIH